MPAAVIGGAVAEWHEALWRVLVALVQPTAL